MNTSRPHSVLTHAQGLIVNQKMSVTDALIEATDTILEFFQIEKLLLTALGGDFEHATLPQIMTAFEKAKVIS